VTSAGFTATPPERSAAEGAAILVVLEIRGVVGGLVKLAGRMDKV
jgi:hypothetical protein